MAFVPRQREVPNARAEIKARADAPDKVKAAIKLFAAEAARDPATLLSALYNGSVLASPQRIIAEHALGDPNEGRNRALGVLARLFRTVVEQPEGITLGADQFIDYDPVTQRVMNALVAEDADRQIARTYRLYMILGLASAALDARMVPAPPPIPRDPLAPWQGAQDA